MDKLHFKTTAAANLFASEITGQLSDGMWENTKPYDHWKYWCDAEVVVDGKVGHEGYPRKTNYNLRSLKRYIKEDMLNAIRITKMPWFTMDFQELTRLLTSKMNLEIEPYGLNYRPPQDLTPEVVRDSWKYTIEAAMRKGKTEDEAVNEFIERQRKSDEWFNANVKSTWDRLNSIGITSLEELREMIKKINAVEVTDRELNDALSEVCLMMEHAI